MIACDWCGQAFGGLPVHRKSMGHVCPECAELAVPPGPDVPPPPGPVDSGLEGVDDRRPEGRRKLDDRQKLNMLMPVPKRTSSLHLRIDAHALARWRAAAKAEHCGLSELVRSVMDRYLNGREFRK